MPISIAIIGAGPAGCMLARLLTHSQLPIKVTIFESESSLDFRSQGGTLDLHASTGQRALKAAGLFDDFLKYARYDGEALKICDKNLLCYITQGGSSNAESSSFSNRPEIDRPQLRKILFAYDGNWPSRSKTCVVEACNDENGGDAKAILAAFDECKEDGHIIFENTTYYVGTVMNTTGLKNVDIELKGTMLWSTDIEYWLQASLPVGFQNQTSAWHLGGEGIHFFGHGAGTLDGNGQVWYDYNHGQSNLHGRPHAITITETKNSVIEGLRFVKSQMWTMTVARSEKVLLQDIYVNNSSEDREFRSNVNTDGVDTVYANNITMLRWTVDCGDDSISMKQNSTNIYIANSTFYNGIGFAMGSIGQYPGQIEVIENVTAENIVTYNSRMGGRVKTWTGLNTGYPPNGGGGGFGHAKNITFRNFELHNAQQAWAITQCTSYNGVKGGCDTSRFKIEGMYWGNVTGTITGTNVATLQCSKATLCENIELVGNHVVRAGSQDEVKGYLCSNVQGKKGFECTGDCDQNRCPH